jgi:excisionase family DNA binding protein
MPTSRPRPTRRTDPATAALFVRIPTEQARRLDRAAFELRRPKQELVSGLLERYVDPDSPASLAELAGGDAGRDDRRRVTIETLEPGGLTLGHHSFRPREPEVLTAEEAGELLQVDAKVVLELAEQGGLPGRFLAGEWRFARAALLGWLAGSDRPTDAETKPSDR